MKNPEVLLDLMNKDSERVLHDFNSTDDAQCPIWVYSPYIDISTDDGFAKRYSAAVSSLKTNINTKLSRWIVEQVRVIRKSCGECGKPEDTAYLAAFVRGHRRNP